MPRIYLSPSLQSGNMTLLGVSEQTLMNFIADAMEPLLRQSNIDFTRNRIGMTLGQVIAESNAGNYDAHVAVHSNAAPTPGTATGSRMYYYTTSTNGRQLANNLVETMKRWYYDPSKVISVGDSTLAELRLVNAPSVISEVAFHDNLRDAQWIRDNIQNIAYALTSGTANFLGVQFTPPCTLGTTPGSTFSWTHLVYGTVCTGGTALNIRSSPNGPIIFSLPNNTQVVVTGPRQNGFIPIRHNTSNGWAAEQFMCICNERAGGVVPPPTTPNTGTVVTSGGNLNMRSAPSTTASIITSIPNGSTVTILGESGNWYQISFGGRTGWASKDFIRPATTAPTTGTVVTSGGNLNMRSAPSASASVIATIPNGSTVTILGESGNWYQISFGGRTGWASKDFIRI